MRHQFTKETAAAAGKKSKRGETKITLEIREVFGQLVNDNLDNVKTWLQEVGSDSPKEAINLIIKLSEFVVPKLRSQELTNNFDIENLSDNELDILIKKLTQNEIETRVN